MKKRDIITVLLFIPVFISMFFLYFQWAKHSELSQMEITIKYWYIIVFCPLWFCGILRWYYR
jgi:hypothetical protein